MSKEVQPSIEQQLADQARINSELRASVSELSNALDVERSVSRRTQAKLAAATALNQVLIDAGLDEAERHSDICFNLSQKIATHESNTKVLTSNNNVLINARDQLIAKLQQRDLVSLGTVQAVSEILEHSTFLASHELLRNVVTLNKASDAASGGFDSLQTSLDRFSNEFSVSLVEEVEAEEKVSEQEKSSRPVHLKHAKTTEKS